MFAERGHFRAGEPQRLRAEIAELAIAQNEHLVAGIELYLRENLEGGRQWFGEHCLLIADVFRNHVEIRRRNRNVFGEGPVGVQYSHDASGRTLTAQVAPAGIAAAATEVDLAGHALADEFLRRIGDTDDEFMAGHAFEAHVTF